MQARAAETSCLLEDGKLPSSLTSLPILTFNNHFTMGSLQNQEAKIPVIDISDANKDAPKQLLDAACKFGFVFVANNEAGISPDLISKLFKISEEFFALPTDVKQEVSIASNKAGKNHGWLSQGVEKLDPNVQKRPDVKE